MTVSSALACDQLFEHKHDAYESMAYELTKIIESTMLFMCQWISECQPKKSENNSLSIHIAHIARLSFSAL